MDAATKPNPKLTDTMSGDRDPRVDDVLSRPSRTSEPPDETPLFAFHPRQTPRVTLWG